MVTLRTSCLLSRKRPSLLSAPPYPRFYSTPFLLSLPCFAFLLYFPSSLLQLLFVILSHFLSCTFFSHFSANFLRFLVLCFTLSFRLTFCSISLPILIIAFLFHFCSSPIFTSIFRLFNFLRISIFLLASLLESSLFPRLVLSFTLRTRWCPASDSNRKRVSA